jgi:uncharacterized protein (DUF1810 family)
MRPPFRLRGCDKVQMDPHDLQRFVDAQRGVYAQVELELQAGRKESHWMWYIFPQLRGLGQSQMAQKFALSSLKEAQAFLDHGVLGPRLRRCTGLVTSVEGRCIEDILGYPDNLKFHSSMTLFAHAATDNQVFMDALSKYYRSELDSRTVAMLRSR